MKLNAETLIIDIILPIFVQFMQYFAFEYGKLAQVPETKIGILLPKFDIFCKSFGSEI